MNLKKQSLYKNKVWHSFHINGQSSYKTVKKNCVFTHSGNTLEHELCKAAIGHELNRMGLEYITECVENANNLRRDLCCLDSGNIYEVESTAFRAARFKGTNAIVCLIEGLTLEEAVAFCVKKARLNG